MALKLLARAAPALLLLAGCATSRQPEVADTLCAQGQAPRTGWRVLPPSAPDRVAALVAAGISVDAAIMADTIGALGPVEMLLAAERQRDGAVSFLLARQALPEMVLLATLDVQATLAIIDCSGERANQLQAQVARIQARRERNLSLAAVALGAGTAVITGGLALGGLARAADLAGIVGGSAEGVAAGALFFGSPTGRLRLGQNLIEELTRQPQHSLAYPPRVWRYLTRRPAPGAPNIIDELFADWRNNGLLAPDGQDDPALRQLIAPDATWSVEDLERRDTMFDLLDARVALMQRSLRGLLEEVVTRPLPAFEAIERARALSRRR